MDAAIQRYNKDTKALEQPLSYKVRRLLDLPSMRHGYIKKLASGVYEAAPIPGYNRTTYTIRQSLGELFCNCQGFGKRKYCSHTKAVMIYKEKTEQPEKQSDLFKQEG